MAEEVDMKVALKEHLEKNDKFAILRKEWSIEERRIEVPPHEASPVASPSRKRLRRSNACFF